MRESQSAWRKLFYGALVYALCFGASVPPFGRGMVRGEDTPDIEDLGGPARGASAPKARGKDDSLVELEKVIEEEESRELGEKPAPRSAARTDPVGADDDIQVLDDDQPPARTARGAPARGAASTQKGVDDEISLDDEALGVPKDEPEPNSKAPISKEGEPSLDEMEQMAGGKESKDDSLSSLDDLGDKTEPPKEDFTSQGARPTERATAADEFSQVPGANPAVRNEITNLEFKMDGTSSRIMVSSRTPLSYRQVKNPGMKQVVYYFENTTTPEKLQRAYDTTEFNSPVALFTLLQINTEGAPSTKLIVQMREDAQPTLVPSDRGLFIDFGPPSANGEPRLVVGKDDDATATEDNIYSGGLNFTGRLIRRLEIKNSDIQDVLRLIARTSGYNIVVGDDVAGKVGTLSLENVPWDQAFALVLQTKKLGYIRQGNVLRVATLNSLQQEKTDSLANERAKIQVEPLRTVLIPISYAKAQDLAQQGRGFLTERGDVTVDTRTNTIIVKDIRKVVERIQKLYAALDTQPPRVSISARFVEMKSSFSRDIGFQNIQFNADLAGINISQSIRPGAAGAVSNTSISASDFAGLLAAFAMSETEKKAKILANPAVSVVANQTATISQSLSAVRRVSSVTAGGIVTDSLQQVTTTLTLNVTPIVAGDGTIFLTVKVSNEIPTLPDDPAGQILIDARNIDTQVLIENGDTAVVGSIFSNQVTSTKSGIPFLMRIPILGFFVSSNAYLDNRNEVFVFLTAKIMNAEEAFKRSF